MHFHAHVFFEPGCVAVAERMRAQIVQALGEIARVGAYIDRAAGPLPKPSLEIAFADRHSASVEHVLKTLRDGHSVLIHPTMEDEVAAHTKLARWLGEQLPLRLEKL